MYKPAIDHRSQLPVGKAGCLKKLLRTSDKADYKAGQRLRTSEGPQPLLCRRYC